MIVTARIPNSESTKSISAVFSKMRSLLGWMVLIDKNESKEEMVKSKATIDVISSINEFSILSEMWIAVITKRQNPSRLAEVLKIWCDVLLAILKFLSKLIKNRMYNS